MLNKILLFILTIVTTPAFLVTFLFALLCRLIRDIVVGPYLRGKYGKDVRFLTSNDTIFALDNPKNPLNARSCFLVKGRANILAYQQRIFTKWVKNTTPGLDMFKFSNRLCSELGYFFWLPENDFKIEQHCYLHDVVPKNENELNQFFGEFLNIPFPKDLSPWSMTCINLDENFPGLEPGPHHIFLAFGHHAMCDGFSFSSVCNIFLFDQSDASLNQTKINQHIKVSTMTKLKRMAGILAFGPGALITNLLTPPDKSTLHGQPLTGIKLFGFSKPVSFDMAKKVKNIMQTTINDVLTSCVGGGLRSLFIKEGISPKASRYIIPVAMHPLNKPPKVENRTSSMIFRDAADQLTSRERLLKTQENMNKLKNAELAVVYLSVLGATCNFIPRCIMSKVAELFGVTTVFSNMPGPTTPCYIFGQKLIRLGCFTHTFAKIGIGIVSVSYNNQVMYGITADVAVIKSQKILDRLLEDIVQELENLQKCVVTK